MVYIISIVQCLVIVLKSQDSSNQAIYLSSSLDFFRILPDARCCVSGKSGKGNALFLSGSANSSALESSLSSELTTGRFPAATAKSSGASGVACVIDIAAGVSRRILISSLLSLIASKACVWISSASAEAAIS
jgi:hypothetical protein